MNLPRIIEKETKFIRELSLPDIQKVRLYQLVYRALNFDSQIYSVLHGSTVVTEKGNIILFGDGVDCVGKTTTALWAAQGGKWVVDEFTVYNDMTGHVYGNKEMPIMIKTEALKYSPVEEVGESEESTKHFMAEDFKLPVVEIAKLDYIVSPHFSEKYNNTLEEEKNVQRKMKKMAILANAHRLKFSQEGLDRGDGNSIKTDTIELIDYMFGYTIPNSLLQIPYYDAYLSESKQIVDLIRKEGI